MDPRAYERQELLRQMIRARRAEERRVGEPVIGNEAVVAGIAHGIGPQDTVVEGGGVPLAIGLGVSTALEGPPLVTVFVLDADSGSAQELREALELAAHWRLPVLFCRENNLHPLGGLASETGFAAEHGIPAWSVDGMDVLAVAEAIDEAVEAIRGGEGPYLLELSTCRFRGRAEVAHWREFDPVRLLADRMRAEDAFTDADLTRLLSEVDADLEAEVAAGVATFEPAR
ncbi:thiamine pyrophosphate-dependent enzyme [Amycolatopsis sp. GM8]|uniref:thiamine pyrophosphate-dependent enzyme n=1 Tax=Amycolatopsis sp. GM8 TaxID=2896530 RepID=UPI001F01BF01|nr:thiamine pyrophosphate-dependent enzyme [Amycolatopsis sp. GM8]